MKNLLKYDTLVRLKLIRLVVCLSAGYLKPDKKSSMKSSVVTELEPGTVDLFSVVIGNGDFQHDM